MRKDRIWNENIRNSFKLAPIAEKFTEFTGDMAALCGEVSTMSCIQLYFYRKARKDKKDSHWRGGLTWPNLLRKPMCLTRQRWKDCLGVVGLGESTPPKVGQGQDKEESIMKIRVYVLFINKRTENYIVALICSLRFIIYYMYNTQFCYFININLFIVIASKGKATCLFSLK